MNTLLWTRRFLVVFAFAFVVIAGAQLLRGRAAQHALVHGLLWSAVSAAIFIGARAYRERRQERCAICDAIDGAKVESGHSG